MPSDHYESKRLFMRDRYSKKLFLVDTGADVSILTAEDDIMSHQHPVGMIFAANGSIIRVYDRQVKHLDLGLGRKFKFSFLVAETENNIIGADFLEHFNLIPDLRNRKLYFGDD